MLGHIRSVQAEGAWMQLLAPARYLRPALASTFVVRGRVVKRGRQQIFTEAQLYGIDAPEKLFATGDAILVPAGPTAPS